MLATIVMDCSSSEPTVVKVVKVGIRVFGIVHDDGTPQAVTVLGGEMAMIPEGA